MASRAVPAIDPGRRRQAYGERSIFYNPGGAAPLGAIVASVKNRDGPNDKSAKRSREGAYRLALCLTPERFGERFGQPPRRPPKGGVVDLAGYDLSRLGELMPQPVHAWMRWVQILSPSRPQYRSLLVESLEVVKAKRKPRPSRARGRTCLGCVSTSAPCCTPPPPTSRCPGRRSRP